MGAEFESRAQAAQLLARELVTQLSVALSGNSGKPLVVAFPSGGASVGVELARLLHWDFDLLPIRKIKGRSRMVSQVEGGGPKEVSEEIRGGVIGAVAEDELYWSRELERGAVKGNPAEFEHLLARQIVRSRSDLRKFRRAGPPLSVEGRTVWIVDDALASPVSMRAAVRLLRDRGAFFIGVAAPGGCREVVDSLAREADRVVCLKTSDRIRSASGWYRSQERISEVALFRMVEETRATGGRSARGRAA